MTSNKIEINEELQYTFVTQYILICNNNNNNGVNKKSF